MIVEAVVVLDYTGRPTFGSAKGLITMAGSLEPGYLPAVKADGNYVIIRSTFALDLAKTKPLVAKVNELYKKKFGMDMSENAARSFTAPFVLADAINLRIMHNFGAAGGPGHRRLHRQSLPHRHLHPDQPPGQLEEHHACDNKKCQHAQHERLPEKEKIPEHSRQAEIGPVHDKTGSHSQQKRTGNDDRIRFNIQ